MPRTYTLHVCDLPPTRPPGPFPHNRWSVILSTLALQKQEGTSSDQQAPDTALSAEAPDQVQAPIDLEIKAAVARDQVGREEEGGDKEKSGAGESDLAGAWRSNYRV